MFKTINLLRALFAAAFLLFIGNALMLSANALVLHDMGFSQLAIGAVGAAIYLGALVSTLTAPRLIYKVGHIRAYGFFIALYTLASLAHIYAQHIALIAALRMVLGYCYYALLATIESWINSRARNENRSRIIAVYEVVFYSGFCIGTLILSLNLSHENIFIFAALALLAAALPLNLLKIKQPAMPRRRERMRLPDVFSVSPLALIAAFIGGFCINGYYATAGVFFLARGYEAADVSVFIACTMFGGFAAQLIIGPLSDFFGRKFAILGCAMLGLAATAALEFAPDSAWALRIICGFFGAGVFCIYALALARASDRVKDAKALLEVGRTLLFAYSLSSVFSPLILGAAVQFGGARAFLAIYAAALCALICYAFTQPKIEPENRAEFKKRPGFFAAMAAGGVAAGDGAGAGGGAVGAGDSGGAGGIYNRNARANNEQDLTNGNFSQICAATDSAAAATDSTAQKAAQR